MVSHPPSLSSTQHSFSSLYFVLLHFDIQYPLAAGIEHLSQMDSYYYDIRYIILPIAAFLKSYSGDGLNNSSFVMIELHLVIVFGLSLMFLLASIRVQLLCCSHNSSSFGRRVQLIHGLSAFSVPVTLSLIVTLFIPISTFWNAYLLIFIMSFWSDSIHSFFTRLSCVQECHFLLPVTENPLFQQPPIQQISGVFIQEVDESSPV